MPNDETRDPLPVIAIGASAGGLEAVRALLKDMPGDLPAAFILVLHLDPTHDSMMVDLLSDHTDLKVVQAAEGMDLRPGRLHVIPSGVFLTVAQGVLHLSEPEGGKGVRLPFDVLLRSLASDAGAVSGCIVLSGTGMDGSSGLAEIHAAGGLVIAQDPAEAGHAGMPESAIATGFVDQVLPAGQIVGALEAFLGVAASSASDRGRAGQKIARRTSAADMARRADDAAPPQDAEEAGARIYDDILAFMGDHAVQYISLYKRGTLERRIARRIASVGIDPENTAGYLEMLRANPQERARLASDLLIHVTGFFRDPEVFDHLSASVIPALLAGLPTDRPLRAWVAGCSTGEEAYSLAITCLEAMEAAGSKVKLQILASDIDPEAVATARTGFYPNSIEESVSQTRLSRFFISEDGGWRANADLRDVIVFTVADLLSDPPFSRIDLVSCRNLLIYLGPEAQKRVIARCCFALRPGGLLLLGAAEMPGPNDDGFAVEDKATRLWRRVGHSNPGDVYYTIGVREATVSRPPGDAPVSRPARRGSLADLCRRVLLENYAPAAALLNTQLEVLYLLGPTDTYLKITEGHPDPGFLGMLPKSLRARVREAAAACTPQNPVVTVSGRRIGGSTGFDLALHSVPGEVEPLLLACFIESPARPPGSSATARQEAPLISRPSSPLPAVSWTRRCVIWNSRSRRTALTRPRHCRSTRNFSPPTRNCWLRRKSCNRSTKS